MQKNLFLVFAIALTFAQTSKAREIRLSDVSLDLHPGDRLAISGVRGNLRVSPVRSQLPENAGGIAHIRKSSTSQSQSSSDALFLRLGFAQHREGNTVFLEPKALDGRKLEALDLAEPGAPELNVEIEAPAVPLEIGWRDGSVQLINWQSSLQLHLVDGLFVGQNNTGNFKLQLQKGDIKIIGHKGNIEVNGHIVSTNFKSVEGQLNVNILSGEVIATQCDGSQEIRSLTGRVNISKSSGNLDFEAGKSTLNISNFIGSIKGQSDEGAVTIESEGEPDISVETVSAPVSVHLLKAPGTNVNLRTDEGQIAPANPAFKVNRQPTFKSLLTKIPGQGRGNLAVKTKSGNIRLR